MKEIDVGCKDTDASAISFCPNDKANLNTDLNDSESDCARTELMATTFIRHTDSTTIMVPMII